MNEADVLRNFRDVGGCRTADGRRVARGLFFRSAEFTCSRGSAAHQILARFGIKRVIDLRASSECSEHEQGDLPNAVQRIRMPFLHSIDQRSFQPVDRSPPATGRRYYEYLLEGRPSVLRVLEQLTTVRENPTVVHCVAGRDRTGIVVACVLSLLNVPDAAIADDYAESRVMDDDEGRNAHPENILCLLRVIRERHGSVAAFVTDDGSEQRRFERLRQALLQQ